MALILPGKSKCALCDKVLAAEDDVFATTAFLTQDHPLWRFSDAGMHHACFMAWPSRLEFVAAFNEVRRHPKQPIMHDDGSLEDVPNPEFDAVAAAVAKDMDRERAKRSAEREKAEQEWAGKSRACPQCGHEFLSVQDKGVCPSCGHVFHASTPNLFDGLDDIDWNDLVHAYGSASDVPALLRSLGSDNKETRDEAVHELFGNIYHQGTIYEATVHALPFLIRALASPDFPDRDWMALLVSGILNGQGYYEVHASSGAQPNGDLAETLENERRVVTAVRRIGLDALPLLTDYLRSPEPEIRGTVAEALACYPTKRDSLLPHLKLALFMELDEEAKERIEESVQRLDSSR